MFSKLVKMFSRKTENTRAQDRFQLLADTVGDDCKDDILIPVLKEHSLEISGTGAPGSAVVCFSYKIGENEFEVYRCSKTYLRSSDGALRPVYEEAMAPQYGDLSPNIDVFFSDLRELFIDVHADRKAAMPRVSDAAREVSSEQRNT